MKKTRRAVRPSAALTAHYIASTHWDREWYEPFQHYRFRLVDVIDAVLDLLERDPAYRSFQLDGQSIVVEDYLEIRPEQRPRLAQLARDGRLLVGPWYVMPDQFLVSGESLVRNLLRGHQVAGEFGPPMKVGFVCDIFGHNSQLPQILRGFEIETAVVWRGTNDSTHPALFRWQAADGSEVLTYTFEDRGYGDYYFDVRMPAYTPAGKLDIRKALGGLRKMFEIGRRRTPGNHLVFFDGLDHTPAEGATPALLAGARRQGMKVVFSSFPEFFAAVRKQRGTLSVVRGELRASGEGPRHVIPGVLSSRIYLKQANAACEQRLLQWAEPWAALAWLLGEPHPTGYLREAWKFLLTNHPHDSICGCSIDQVHRDMEYRFDQCRLIAERVAQMSLRAIADRTPRPALPGEEDYAVTLFNPGTEALEGVLDFPLVFPRETANRFAEWFNYEPIIGFRLFDADGTEIPAQRLDVTKLAPLKTYDRIAGFQGEKRERVRVAARVRVPPCGWTTLICRPTKDRTRTGGTQLVDDHTMENEHLRARVGPNGTLELTDKAGGHVYRDLLTLEDRADIGDGWYHGTAVNDEVFTSTGAAADVAVIHDGFALTTLRVRVVINVPERFLLDKEVMRRSGRLLPLAVTSWLTLRAGGRWLEVLTEVENTVRDHRLRVLLPTDLVVETYFADSPFDVVERPIALRPETLRWFEPEVETKPQYSFTAVNDGTRGLALISTGQPESAVRDLPRRPIALTLLRGFQRTVSMEGEDGGQMLGRSQHRYWLYPHAGPLPAAELLRLGQRLAGGLECIYTERGRLPRLDAAGIEPRLPAAGSWLRPGEGPLVLTACKRSEDGAALVVRLFNPTVEPAEQRLEFITRVRAARRANLLEEPREPLATRGRGVTITARPREIVTLRVELEGLESREVRSRGS